MDKGLLFFYDWEECFDSLALRESNPFGLKRKIACLTVLKKLDNSLIACTFLPCNPTYFLV